ncbi:MAG TPA: HNH endonuclease signature motif containing protein [Candidatus Nanoarchaeia archaeon]|nr:HNH endonuclease signature motif containing protein [Candidatus Nanoarchaeia archaeon]
MTKNIFNWEFKPVKIKPISSIYGTKEPKRKPIKGGTRTNMLADSGAKCQKCRDPLKGLKPHIHHKNGNPTDNRSGNLILVCPNCHSKLHRNMKSKKSTSKKCNTWINPLTGRKEKFDLLKI